MLIGHTMRRFLRNEKNGFVKTSQHWKLQFVNRSLGFQNWSNCNRGEWPRGLERCDQIGRFMVQSLLATWLSLGIRAHFEIDMKGI